MSATHNRLSGFGATLLIALFVIGYPLVLLAIGVAPWHESLSDIGTLLTSPDDGTLALLLVAVFAWGLWALGTALFAVEILAAIRGVSAPRLPGLGLPQAYAGNLVAVAALLFVAVPAIAPAFAPQPAQAAPTIQGPVATQAPVAELAATPEPANALVLAAKDTESRTFDYTFRRGESLWKVAERFLGDGRRYKELHALNRDVLGDNPDFILPGTVIRVPVEGDEAVVGSAESPAPGEHTRVVAPGDWLSTIAAEELGDAKRFMEIFDASKHLIQPDGDKLTDPDLIRPGWLLIIPGEVVDTPPPVEPPVDIEPSTPEMEPEPTEPGQPTPDTENPKTPEIEPAPADVQPDGTENDQAENASPGWLVPGLAGAGAVLAAGLLTALRRRQRTQLRYRRPGHIVVPPPPSLTDLEKTLHVEGSSMAPQIEALDHALRQISTSPRGLPDVIALGLSAAGATLHLGVDDEDAILPEPWTGTGRTRIAPLRSDGAKPSDQSPPPYPLLVAVGQDDDGTVWFLNLGHAAHVAVTGAVTGGEDFLRHLAAELALNPWSAEVDIDTFGLSPTLADLDPARLHHHDDTRLLDKLSAELGQPGIPGLAPERRRTLLLERTYADTDASHAITSANDSHSARGITVVTVGDHLTEESLVLEVDESARLTISILGLTVAAAGLSEEEASSCVAILDVTRDTTLAPVPVDEAAIGRDRLVDKAGALRDEFVDSRPANTTGEAAGGTALLPRPTSEYPDVAATTPEDVEALAPVVPEATRTAVEDADPTLDQEVAWWFDLACRLPRISILGPVHGRAHGDAADVAGRKPFYTEMLAFLALHPDGVTSAQVADAFAITPKRARVDMNALRSWLGTNPHTGRPHLPKADESRAARQRGGHFYQVDDVLLDADLFRRLRARGQARGAAGINDLATALRLVTGQPFGQLRTNGWAWVLESDRLDHILTCAIVDVAHIVTTHALAEGDLAMAHEAVEVAHHAAPYDEITNLDLVAVASAEGHEELAEQLLNDRIYNRSDDDLGPVELPPRTHDMTSKRSQNGSQPSGNRPVAAPRKG